MSLEQQILKYENDFFVKKFCDNIQNLNSRIHDEFIEFGKSGKVFGKSSIIDHLNNLDNDKNVEILDFKIDKIKEDLIIAYYLAYEIDLEIKTLRTSIWKKEVSDWELYFHQGTATTIDKLE